MALTTGLCGTWTFIFALHLVVMGGPTQQDLLRLAGCTVAFIVMVASPRNPSQAVICAMGVVLFNATWFFSFCEGSDFHSLLLLWCIPTALAFPLAIKTLVSYHEQNWRRRALRAALARR